MNGIKNIARVGGISKIGLKTALLLALCGFSAGAQAKSMFFPLQSKSLRAPNLKAGRLVYYGGPVISQVKVYAVFWGAAVDSGVQKNIGGFYKAVTNSNQMDWLSEYNTTGIKAVDGRDGTNQTIGRGSYGGEYLITPAETKTDLDDKDIRAELESQIAAHVLPAPDENSLYMIYFPAGVSISIEGMKSCSSFCAYHNGFASSKFGSIFYGIMPDFTSGACSFGCGFSGDSFKTNTIISSHEFVEAVTDPFPTPGNSPAFPQAWNTTGGEEIGDLCASTSGELLTSAETFTVQGEWDNATDKCLTGPYQTSELLR